MKRCSTCGEEKGAGDFHKKAASSDGLQSVCRACASDQIRNWYSENRERQAYTKAVWNHAQWLVNTHKIREHLKQHPCVDCGEADPVVLEFDHVRGEKTATIATKVRDWTWARIEAEIAKCEVRCANCHRRRTAAVRDYPRVRLRRGH